MPAKGKSLSLETRAKLRQRWADPERRARLEENLRRKRAEKRKAKA
jgi:hypothetical protein